MKRFLSCMALAAACTAWAQGPAQREAASQPQARLAAELRKALADNGPVLLLVATPAESLVPARSFDIYDCSQQEALPAQAERQARALAPLLERGLAGMRDRTTVVTGTACAVRDVGRILFGTADTWRALDVRSAGDNPEAAGVRGLVRTFRDNVAGAGSSVTALVMTPSAMKTLGLPLPAADVIALKRSAQGQMEPILAWHWSDVPLAAPTAR